jgi:hypothetical protein
MQGKLPVAARKPAWDMISSGFFAYKSKRRQKTVQSDGFTLSIMCIHKNVVVRKACRKPGSVLPVVRTGTTNPSHH